MAFGFTREAPVLDFGPRAHVPPSKREYLLWPTWAYRIVAPQVRERQLNMFQRAVLGLCRAGVLEAESIGNKLTIHVDLATFILTELTALRCLNPDHSLTKHGLQVLEDDSLEAHDMVAGYVFQDPWDGKLWPRFVEHLDYCDLDCDERGFLKLVRGSPGRPRRQNAFMVREDTPQPSRPSAASVVAAVSGHRHALRHADTLPPWDDDEDANRFSASGAQIDRVSFVEENPSPVYLMTYLYLPENPADGFDWYACDPFGLGPSIRIRRRIDHLMQGAPALHRVVNRLVGRGLHEDLEQQKRWIEQLRTSAALEIERRLTVNIRAHDAFDQLLDMESAHQEALQLGNDCPDSKIKEALRSCVKVLERVFGVITSRFPLTDVWKRVYVSRINSRTGERKLARQNESVMFGAIYRSAACAVGFEEPLPTSLLKVRPGHIWSVVQFGEHWRLRPMVCANILAAQVDMSHPLREAAGRNPRLLEEIEHVARRGGMAGHANDESVSLDTLEETIERTYLIISVLTGFGLSENRDIHDEDGAVHG